MTNPLLMPRIYLNGFPKSGLHMVEAMVREISRPAGKNNWLGSFDDNAFTNNWLDADMFARNIPRILPGYYAKGHCGWTPKIASTFKDNGIAMVFIYRDMRDVAVSLTHHARSVGQDGLVHPNKQHYADMTFQEALQAIISGDDLFPGVYDRWLLYAPWLLEDGVLKLRFEDIKAKPQETAELIIRYVYGHTAAHRNNTISISHDDAMNAITRMVQAVARKDTGTFRRGKAGTWREVWSAPVAETFARCEHTFIQQMEQQLQARLSA